MSSSTFSRIVLASLLLALAATSTLAQQQQQNNAAGAAPGQQKKCLDVNTVVLGRSGIKYGSGTFGVLHDAYKRPIVRLLKEDAYAKPLSPDQVSNRAQGRFTSKAKLVDLYSNGPDMPTLHEVGGKAFLINHFEAPQPSTAYISELAADSNGKLRIVNTAPVDDTAQDVQGLWFMCRGEKTPWGTHIGGEEYPPDCAEYEQVLLPCTNATGYCGFSESSSGEGVLEFARYYGYYPGAEEVGQPGAALKGDNLEDFKAKFSCYNYGASPEISITSASGATRVVKWRTLGRISHETAVVMPDNRTVYSTDDGTNGVLLMFKADNPGDLSSGTLSAARFSSEGPTSFSIDWIELGKSTQSELQALATNPATRFSSLFDEAQPGQDGKCPEGFSPANPPSAYWKKKVNGKTLYLQCLKIKAGQEDAAAFLETQRVAGMKGATAEFEKLEGFTFDPATRTAYAAITRIDKSMLKASPTDGLGSDTLQMEPNPCGVIMALDLNQDFEATSAKVILSGNNKTNTDALNKCDINAISGPDNIYYSSGNLLIAEDTTSHFNNYLWAYNLKNGALSRILSSPTGAEVSGPSFQWSGGRAYLTWVAQHPQDFEGNKLPRDAHEEEAMRAYVAYLGPFSPEAVAGKLDFAAGALAPPGTSGEKLRILATDKVCPQQK